MGNSTKGTLCGIVAAMSYGTNPLFSLNLLNMGLDVESILFYRFAFAVVVLGAFISLRGKSLAIKCGTALPLFVAGVIFAMSSQTLYESFLYMDAGIACTILFIYPILVAVIMAVFFRERASFLTYACIVVAVVGIALLYKGEGDATLSTTGMLLVAASSLCYAVYIVGVDHSVLRNVPSARMTFWVLVAGMLTFFVFTGFGTRLHPIIPTAGCIANILGVALMPTVIPILFINVAIKKIGPTYSAILGALEPVTALAIGVTVFGEALTARIAIGALLIFTAVTTIVSRPLLKNYFAGK